MDNKLKHELSVAREKAAEYIGKCDWASSEGWEYINSMETALDKPVNELTAADLLRMGESMEGLKQMLSDLDPEHDDVWLRKEWK